MPELTRFGAGTRRNLQNASNEREAATTRRGTSERFGRDGRQAGRMRSGGARPWYRRSMVSDGEWREALPRAESGARCLGQARRWLWMPEVTARRWEVVYFTLGGVAMVPLYIHMERWEADSGVTAPPETKDSSVCAQWGAEAREAEADRLSQGS